jgi:hypothetical protein
VWGVFVTVSARAARIGSQAPHLIYRLVLMNVYHRM